jgi:hypothetical protein
MSNITPVSARHMLSAVPEDKVFFCKDDRVFAKLEDLDEALKSMSKDTFQHHVNAEKNDFSTWIYDVVGDVELANSIREIKNKNAILKKFKKHMSYIKEVARN